MLFESAFGKAPKGREIVEIKLGKKGKAKPVMLDSFSLEPLNGQDASNPYYKKRMEKAFFLLRPLYTYQ